MRIKIVIVLLFLFCLGQIHSFAQKEFNGPWDYEWVPSLSDGYLRVKIDSTTTPLSIYFETFRDKKGVLSFTSPIYQESNSDAEVSIRINYKTENCTEFYFKLTGIGGCEKIISTDTLHMELNEEWISVNKTIEINNSSFLKLSVESKGYEYHNARVWIDELDVFIDGEHINEIKTSGKEFASSLTKKDIIPLDNKNLSDLPFIDKRILAIGESVHGTEEFNETAIKIIKERILNQNCRIVLMEISLEFSFYINRYINGDQNFKLDYISSYFDQSLFSNSFLSLIEWIKAYNSSHLEKVHFWGIDINIFPLKSRMDLYDFLYTINERENDRELKRLCKLFVSK